MAPSAHDLESAAADAFASIHVTARRARRGDGTLPHSRPGLASPVKLPRGGPGSPDFPPRMLQDVVLSTDSRSSNVEFAGVATGGARADAPPPGFTSAAAFDTGGTFSNPLFSNPLFADSSLSIMDLDDASLARIFGKLLDPEYPNAVWSGSFPPGRAAALLASTSASASAAAPPAPLHHFPLDGRPNDGTRALMATTLVCQRWRRIVRARVVKYVAAFGPGADPLEEPPTDASAAAEDPDDSETWSSEGGSAGSLSVASRAQSSGASLGDPPAPAGGALHGTMAGGRPRRWPLRCRAHVVVAALRSDGVVPFDLRSLDRHSLRSVFLMIAPEHAPAACMTAYDARALSGCSSLTSLTLPASPPPSIGWNLLGSFPLLAHFDFVATATASLNVGGSLRLSTGSTRSVHSRTSSVTVPSAVAPSVALALPMSTLTSLAHVAAPWASLAVVSSNTRKTLTSLRLRRGGPVNPDALAPIASMTTLRALDLSTPLRWSVDTPGALPKGSDADTVQLPAAGFSPLAALHHSLRSLCLSGNSRVDATTLATVVSLTALTALDLSVCRRVDNAAVECLPALSRLETLDLAWCTGVGSPGAVHLGALRTLRALDMTGCVTLDDIGAFALAGLTRLTRLGLRGCPRIGYPAMQSFGDYLAPKLMHVELSSDTDAGAGLFSMLTPRAGNGGRVAPLTHLALRGFRAVPDSAFRPLSLLRAVRALTLDCCPEAGEGAVEAIAPLTTLTRLVLRFCPGVTDASLKHLSGMTRLQVLSLQGSKRLYGGGLKNIAALGALWSVDLQQCLCLDACGLGCLAPLRRLSLLNVGKCSRIEASDFAHLPELRALEHLVIAGLEAREAQAVRDHGFKVIEPAGK